MDYVKILSKEIENSNSIYVEHVSDYELRLYYRGRIAGLEFALDLFNMVNKVSKT